MNANIIITTHTPPPNNNNQQELLASADSNQDGLIDYQEFSVLLRNNNEALRNSGRASAKGSLARFL